MHTLYFVNYYTRLSLGMSTTKLNFIARNKLSYVELNKPTRTIVKQNNDTDNIVKEIRARNNSIKIKQVCDTKYDDLIDRQLFGIDTRKKLNFDNYFAIIRCVGGDIFGDDCCYSYEINQRIGDRYYPLRKLLYNNYVAPEPKHSLSTICLKNSVNCCNINHFYIKNRDQKYRYVDLLNDKQFLDTCSRVIDIINNIDCIIYDSDDYYAACNIFNIFNNIEQTYYSMYSFRSYLVKNNLLKENTITMGVHKLAFKLATNFDTIISLVKSCRFIINFEPINTNIEVTSSDVQKYLFFPQSLINSYCLATFGTMYTTENNCHSKLNSTIIKMKKMLKIN
jgi:hypothetical protein